MDFNEKLIKYRVIEKKCRVNNFILGKNIIYLPFVDSTNNYLKNMNTAKSDVCIISDIQKTGRGRGRNSFVSPSGGLYLSFYLHNKINEIITNKTLICFVLANICVTVIKKYVKNAYLKWPNDIYINDKKVCGILIENIYHGNLLKKTIVGVGININTDFSCSNLNFCSIKEFYSLTKASSFQKKIDKDIDIPDFFRNSEKI